MPHATIDETLQMALQHHQAGRLQQAEDMYRLVLTQSPRHALAMHHLGLIAHQAGRGDEAVDLIRRSIALVPNHAEAYYNFGVALEGSGQVDEAIAAYRRAIALKPNMSAAYDKLGNALKQIGQFEEAAAVYRRAIALRPDNADAYGNLGAALLARGVIDRAIAACRQAIALQPCNAHAHNYLGCALREKGQIDEAIAACQQAIVLRPDYAQAHSNLGVALHQQGQIDEAIAAYRRALDLRPDLPETHTNLGNALRDKGLLVEAIAAYRQAVALNPRAAEFHSNLGVALGDDGQFDEAIAAQSRAIALAPQLPELHCNLGFAHLSKGALEQGWEKLEWRWKSKDFPSPRPNFSQPLWDGMPLEERTILLHSEQGFGDTIQFIRYLPMVQGRGGKIIIECQPELDRLLRTMAGNCKIVARGQPLPAFDSHCPLLSLPRVFATTLANIPNTVPYLQPNAADAAKWQSLLADHSDAVKVGIAWAGSPTHKSDRSRSLQPSLLAPLGRVPGVRLFSLQKGMAAAQAIARGSEMDVIDRTQELKDFADTAGLIANLDLVVTVDTAVAHLAGAMGKPVWLLLAFVPDWRWLRDREDSPWYPSMRLFRQPSAGAWNSVIKRVVDELSHWTKEQEEHHATCHYR